MKGLIEDSYVVELVQGVFSATLGMNCAPCDRGGGEGCVQSTVGITGAWNGDVTVRLGRSLAKEAAARMFMVEAAALVEADVLDAVGELSNQVAGSVKAILPAPSDLKLPRMGSEDERVRDDGESATFWFSAEGECFSVIFNPQSNAHAA